MPEYHMPRLRTGKDEQEDGSKPYTFSQCLVERDGAIFNIVFIVDNKSMVVPVSQAAASELFTQLTQFDLKLKRVD